MHREFVRGGGGANEDDNSKFDEYREIGTVTDTLQSGWHKVTEQTTESDKKHLFDSPKQSLIKLLTQAGVSYKTKHQNKIF